MSLAERERAELFEGLMPTLGREVTEKLVDALPPAGEPLATEKQVDDRFAAVDRRFTSLEQRMDDRFTAVDRRMDDRFSGVDQRFTSLEQRMDDRFSGVEQRFTSLEQRMDDRFSGVDGQFAAFERRMEDGFAQLRAEIAAQGAELLAAFRGELVTAVSGQTRAVVVATASAVFGIGGLAVTLAQVL